MRGLFLDEFSSPAINTPNGEKARCISAMQNVAFGPKRHFAAAQQSVAFGGKATSQLSGATFECHLFGIPLIDAITIASDNRSYRN
jgi:hypothetical protein